MKPDRLLTVLSLVVLAGCSSSSQQAREPEIRQRSQYFIEYRGTELNAELSYHWAARHLGDTWLVLKLSLATAHGASVLIDRDSVKVRTPEGHTLSLIDQSEFRRVHGKLHTALDRSQVWAPPTFRFMGSRQPHGFWFLSPPGDFFDRSSLRLHTSQWASGPLVFQVPVGVQPGRWVLMIDLEESDVRIPFVMEDDREP
jgi:hypothetical protein